MTRGRELVGYAIADEIAAPIPVSIGRASRKHHPTWFGIACCRHCADMIYVEQRGDAWRHKETGSHNCREARVNTTDVLPHGGHRLERHPRSGMWHCPTCARGPWVFTFSGYDAAGTPIAGRLELADRADLAMWTERMYRNGCTDLSVYEGDRLERVAGIGAMPESGTRGWWATS